MKEAGGSAFSNILLPQYEYNESLKVYVEIDPPKSSLYKSVGYNDLNTIKEIMDGDDSEKRSADFAEK